MYLDKNEPFMPDYSVKRMSPSEIVGKEIRRAQLHLLYKTLLK